ncbi:Xylan glycosyltransferase MUCI21 [Linum perenne]
MKMKPTKPTKPKSCYDICFEIISYWVVPTLLFLSMLLLVYTPSLSPLLSGYFWSPLTEVNWTPVLQPSVINFSPPLVKITCDRSHKIYDLCKITGPTVVDPITSTFYTVGPPMVEKIKAYPRKQDSNSMSRIQEITLTSTPTIGPTCQAHHGDLPAVVFSAAGYTGNFFHDFSEGFIPLFITVNTLFPSDRGEFILVVSEARNWWIQKYSDLLLSFTRHPIIVIGNRADVNASDVTHCFGSAVVGLISHGMATINSSLIPGSLDLSDFRYLLEETYGHWVTYWVHNSSMTHNNDSHESTTMGIKSKRPGSQSPKMVLISRPKEVGRAILNEEEVRVVAEEVGFEVVMFQPRTNTSVQEAYRLIDSADAVFGMHGAAMTHLLFMRPRAVFVQVVPLAAEWAAEVCYGSPAKAMGLQYMEYRITANESSLAEKYGLESLVVKDPIAFGGKGWGKMKIYLKEQDVRIDLVRLRVYLKEAYGKALEFMRTKGQ